MSSKRSVKPSQAFRDSQENKGTAERYLEPAFIRELREKAAGYFIGADKRKSSKKEWFPKKITEDPLFKAIVYLRRRHENKQKLAERFPELLDELLDPEDPEPARLLVDIVRQGNIGKLKDAVTFCELFENKYRQTREGQSDPLPWEYYTARAALGFLAKGVIPIKRAVKEAALKERAIAELPVMYRAGTEELLPKMQEAGEPKEMRMDPEPAPDQDPESYYEADRGELDDDPSIEIPAKRDLSEKERLRIKRLLRERIVKWESDPDQLRRERIIQRQEAKQVEPRTEGRQRLTEDEKPALAKQRAKLIDGRIEELRREHTPSTWRHIWKRAFKDLGLGCLPRKH